MSQTLSAPETRPEKAKNAGLALYPSDLEDVKRIQQHFELDSLSQAVRRAIRITIRTITPTDEPEQNGEAA